MIVLNRYPKIVKWEAVMICGLKGTVLKEACERWEE